jgi:hypothetical protein
MKQPVEAAKEPVGAVMQTTTVTLSDLLATAYPQPGTGHVLIESEYGNRNYFRTLADGQWREQASTLPGDHVPTLDEFTGRNEGVNLKFAPVLFPAPGPGRICPVGLLACSLRLVALPDPRGTGLVRIDPFSEGRARERLQGCGLRPSGVLNEGFRLSALWLLQPVEDGPRLQRVLHRLIVMLGAEGGLDLAQMRLAVPGTRTTSVIPSRFTGIEAFDPTRRFGLDQLEFFLDGGRS